MKYPNKTTAEQLLAEAESLNNGIWVAHNRMAALAAEKIASNCDGLDEEKAFSLGMLHDIGRREGIFDLKHTILGYRFMLGLGYVESARICLTHSFPYKDIHSYNGHDDCTEQDSYFIQEFIDAQEYDEYDKLIQLCDAIAYPTGIFMLEKRFVDVVMRKGFDDYTIKKWKALLSIKEEFDIKAGCNIYSMFY